MSVVGIDIGKSQHVAAVCRDQAQEAEREVLRLGSGRGGFELLDAWMDRQGEVSLVVMESSGHYWMPLASHLKSQGRRLGRPTRRTSAGTHAPVKTPGRTCPAPSCGLRCCSLPGATRTIRGGSMDGCWVPGPAVPS